MFSCLMYVKLILTTDNERSAVLIIGLERFLSIYSLIVTYLNFKNNKT